MPEPFTCLGHQNSLFVAFRIPELQQQHLNFSGVKKTEEVVRQGLQGVSAVWGEGMEELEVIGGCSPAYLIFSYPISDS